MNLSIFRNVIAYLRTPVSQSRIRLHNELKEEIEFHLHSSVREQLDRGADLQSAKQEAIDRFGDLGQVIEDCGGIALAGPVFWHRAHLVVTGSLVCVVAALAFLVTQRIPAGDQPTGVGLVVEKDGANTTGLNDSGRFNYATGCLAEDSTGDVVGSVTDVLGEPLVSANVMVVVKTWPKDGYRQQSYMATTGPNGAFEIRDVYPPGIEYKVQVTAIAEGSLLAMESTEVRTGELAPFEFRLHESVPLELKFVSADGEPLEGVSAIPSFREDQSGSQHFVYFYGSDPLVKRSDQEGRVSMPHFLPGEKVAFNVQFPGDNWQVREIVVPDSRQFVELRPQKLVVRD